jgi:hypothetical protein
MGIAMENLSHYLKPRVRFARQLWLVAVALMILAGFLCLKIYQKHETVEKNFLKIEQIRAKQAPQVVPKMSRGQQDEQKRWDALKIEREFTWTPLFQAIEHAGSANIELLEFQPDKASNRMILRGEAKNHEALMAFLEKLEAQSALKNVHLTHQENMMRERLSTVTFEIKATLAN